ncbi:HAUS augmin-like complex subunit 6 N-terminus-domain-containing protein [Bombardia bombarda]|uniref:HAUS augmin-like complex subunit 6 N-terminus-domain-containing protein n=1 Tax=Bombardia bombarda TaxID=252184 RepID=A0AA40CGK8_9PEZI|nr:HAUS augmin-like complex subunit 6 N-terminus-domain-containing protein [Bombardia bombarda]
MASLYGSSALARTRSTRPPANTGRPIQSSTRTPSLSAAHSITPSAPASATPTAASSISLFLTNLRLLDLDLRQDWPDINTLTFSAKDAAQGQKKRIQCVEWALYHLFTLWDPDEARNKLRPFFPPLDQVQSLNLRAALLRCLEQAKKNGVLGRDAVVRKTMLDECKGDRLAEVLAVFSSAVLMKLVAEQQLNEPEHPALAQTLALENRGYSGERTELVVLTLAYKLSLRRIVDDKNAARAKYNEFARLLRLKDQVIAKRRDEAKAISRKGQGKMHISGHRKLDVWRTVRNNWSGNERWMETLLYGDTHAHKDGVLSTPFDRVWRRVESGRLAELQDTNSDGLLEQLDHRVTSQKLRLEKWQQFRQKMFGKTSRLELTAKEADSRPRQQGIDLGFRAHENLHFGLVNATRKLPRTRPAELHTEYKELVQSLNAELESIDRGPAQVPSFFQRQRESAKKGYEFPETTSPEPETISELSDLEEEIPLVSSHLPIQTSPYRERATILEPAFELGPRRSKTVNIAPSHSISEQQPELSSSSSSSSQLWRPAPIPSRHSTAARRRPADAINASPSTSPTKASPERRHQPSPPKPMSPARSRSLKSPPKLRSSAMPSMPARTPSPGSPVSPTQQLADQILASVSAASPSPLKRRHTLSLAERTRLSMARRTSQVNQLAGGSGGGGLAEESSDSEYGRLPVNRRAPLASSVEMPDEDDNDDQQYEDLVARTRRSMAGFEAAQKKAQLERRRSLRKQKVAPTTPGGGGGGGGGRNGYFNAVAEEEGEGMGEGDSTMVITEELMSAGQDVDYDAVFMSRPKIKTSPVASPARMGGWDE